MNMEKRMSATEARVHFDEVIRHVVEAEEPVIVERAGKPEAVIIALAEYRRLQGLDPDDWRAQLDEVHALIRKERGDQPLNPSPEEIIREMRDEWNEDRFGRLR
jgi:prevent-host-death family protein